MSPTAFADKIKINRSSLTHIFSGRNQPSLDIAKKILLAFPEISTEWLIMGMGDMLQPVPSEMEEPTNVKTVDNMQQTDLFSGTEDAYPELEAEDAVGERVMPDSVPSAPEAAVRENRDGGAVGGKLGLSEIKVPVGVVESTPAPVESVRTEPAPRQGRGRSRATEPHISGIGPKRDRISNSPGDKKIVKIVFFYDDRSFEEYRPS